MEVFVLEMRINEALNALTLKPVKSTTFERIKLFDKYYKNDKSVSQPLKFGRILKNVLSEISVPVNANDLILGRVAEKVLNSDEELFFKSFIESENFYNAVSADGGHCCFYWEDLINNGICGLKKRAQQSLSVCNEPDKSDFFRGMIYVYEAIEIYIMRYAAAAENNNMTEQAAVLKSISVNKPHTFYEALQLLWIVTLIFCSYIAANPTLALGRMDVFLYPLYKNDIEAGVLTKESAKKFILDYYCKHNLIMGRGEHQRGSLDTTTTFSRNLNFDAPEYLYLGGTDENGNDAVNELTYLFAETIEPRFKNPVIVVRYYKNMNKIHPQLWHTIMEKAKKSASMMIYNDNDIISAFESCGICRSDAQKYGLFGCNWPCICGKSIWMQGTNGAIGRRSIKTPDEKRILAVPYLRTNMPNGWPEDFMIVFNKLADEEDVCIEDFYDRFFERMGAFLDRKLEYLSLNFSKRSEKPSAVLFFADCFYENCGYSGKSAAASDDTYHFELQSFFGMATVIDCFTTVDELVFKRKLISLKELKFAVYNNFEDKLILSMCRGVDKFGSESELSNYHANRIISKMTELISEKNKSYFKKQRIMLCPCLQSDTWHIVMGQNLGATPDGRKEGEPFSQNSHPSAGACKNGLTAMFNSLLHIPFERITSGAVNVDIQPSQFEGEEGTKRLETLIASYFNRGGLQVQISSVSVEDMRDAQINPDAHRDLTVRITGYSAVFTDLEKFVQDDVIARNEF